MAGEIAEITLANLALAEVGEEPLQSLRDQSKANDIVTRVLPQARNEIFDLPCNWKFASARVQLSPLSNTPAFGYDYQFALPALYRRLIAFVDESGDDIEYPYRREVYIAGSNQVPVLLSDTTPCRMRYLALLTNVGLWPGWFSKMVYLNIAHKICKPLTRDIRQKVDIANRLKDAYIAAKAANGMEDADVDDNQVNLDLGNDDVLNAGEDGI